MSQFQHHHQLQHHNQQQHQQLHDFFQKPKESGNIAKTGFNKKTYVAQKLLIF
jgi:hypothetical protein